MTFVTLPPTSELTTKASDNIALKETKSETRMKLREMGEGTAAAEMSPLLLFTTSAFIMYRAGERSETIQDNTSSRRARTTKR